MDVRGKTSQVLRFCALTHKAVKEFLRTYENFYTLKSKCTYSGVSADVRRKTPRRGAIRLSRISLG